MFLSNSVHKFVLQALVGFLICLPSFAQIIEYADVARLARAKQYPEALTKADQYLAGKPRDPQMRFLKGVVQSEMGKISEATTTFTRLTEDFPELPEPYNNLAVIYATTGQFDKARSALEMALRTNPSYSAAHENLGDIYAKLASQSYAKALQLDTSNTAAPTKLTLLRELFTASAGTKPVPVPAASVPTAPAAPAPTAPAPAAQMPAQTPAANPVVAPLQPKLPNAILSSPTGSSQPNLAPSGVTSALSTREIESAVKAWAKAWSDRDMKAYLASYTKDYSPNAKQTNATWGEERKLRIMGKSQINVRLSNLSVVMGSNGTSATVKFKQDYKADSLATNSRKTLEMVKSGDRWVITKEIAG